MIMILIMIMVYNNLSHLPLPPSPSSATTGTCEANDGANQVERTTWWDDSGEMRRLGTRDRTDFEIDVSSKIPGKVVKMKSMMKQTLFDLYFSRCAKGIPESPTSFCCPALGGDASLVRCNNTCYNSSSNKWPRGVERLPDGVGQIENFGTPLRCYDSIS